MALNSILSRGEKWGSLAGEMKDGNESSFFIINQLQCFLGRHDFAFVLIKNLLCPRSGEHHGLEASANNDHLWLLRIKEVEFFLGKRGVKAFCAVRE